MTFGKHRNDSCTLEKSEALALCSRLRSAKRAKASLSFEIGLLGLYVDADKAPDEDVIITIQPITDEWEVSLWAEEAEALADVIEGVAKSTNSYSTGAVNFLS